MKPVLRDLTVLGNSPPCKPSRIETDDLPQEKCGVVGIALPRGEEAAALNYYALFALQHRGQEGAGMTTSDGRQLRQVKEMGLVNQIFDLKAFERLRGHLSIGHTRYSTDGSKLAAQPFDCESEIGPVALAHNGNLVNTRQLRAEVIAEGAKLITDIDSEVMLTIFANRLIDGPVAAVREVMERCRGAFSVTVLTQQLVIGFRDPYGIRPLHFGTLPDGGFMIASETCAFVPIEGEPVRELNPGEMVIIENGEATFHQVVPPVREALCLFELIYFARPDSNMYGGAIYSARERMGRALADGDDVEADIVIPVPDSGVPAALGYSRASGIEYAEGMMKSRYIHRTFIEPDDKKRKRGVKMKLSPLPENLEGKRVVLVDDSIVRGHTTRKIVGLLKANGAKEVHVRITAPRITFPCFYGIDFATRDQLIAAQMTNEQIRVDVGADSLRYLTLEAAMAAVGQPETRLCTACFSGQYPIPLPPEQHALAFS